MVVAIQEPSRDRQRQPATTPPSRDPPRRGHRHADLRRARGERRTVGRGRPAPRGLRRRHRGAQRRPPPPDGGGRGTERKRGVEGKGGSVRVDHGGRRYITKKTTKKIQQCHKN